MRLSVNVLHTSCSIFTIFPEERQRTIQKSIAIPFWLNELAEKEDIDISQVLQEALKKKCTSNNHHTKKRHVSYCPTAFSGTAVSALTFVPFFIFLCAYELFRPPEKVE